MTHSRSSSDKPRISRRAPIGAATLLASAVLLEAIPQESRAPGRSGTPPARTARGTTSGATGSDVTSGSAGSETTRGMTGNDEVRGTTGREVTRGATSTGVTSGATFTDVTRGTTGTDVTRGASGTEATSGPTTGSLGMPGPPRELPTSADRIAGSPERHVGLRVLLAGDVSLVESEGLFALETSAATPGTVLVLNPRPSSPPATGARVTLSGTVRPFSLQELGPIDRLAADVEALEARYAGRPVVVADSIRTSDGRELVEAPSPR